ncbi:MAG: hypothetical protein PHP52_02695 [Bacteroidales bacterium]|nr:hypothetical protein [Bacteroidales bacterium]
MKNLMGRSICLMAFVSLFGLTSCDKELNEEVSPQNKYITYQSSDEYSKKLNEIVNMTQEERANYEISNGYISFGRYCDEFYSTIDFEQFKSMDEIITFVNKNKEYLKLNVDVNGEYTVDVAYDDKFSRYMCGLNKIFIIKDTAYKVLEDNLIYCNSGYVEELEKITEDNYLNYMKINEFAFIDSRQGLNTLKDDSTNYGKSLEATVTNGNNRTKSMAIIELGPPTLNYKATCYAGAKVRPYKKTALVWYFCTRTIDLNTNFIVHYEINDTWAPTPTYSYNSTIYASVHEYSLTAVPYYVDDAHFGDVYVYGDTPDTSPAIINY